MAAVASPLQTSLGQRGHHEGAGEEERGREAALVVIKN